MDKLKHSFTANTQEGEIVFDGYGGESETVYVEIKRWKKRGDLKDFSQGDLTRDQVKELRDYLTAWLDATEPSD